MKNNWFQRTLCSFLALVLVLGYVPLSTRAEESGTATDVVAPATEPATEPVTEPATEPVTEPATEPSTEPATEPSTEPATEPVTEPATEAEPEEALLPEISAMASVQYPISGSLGALTWELTKDGVMTISGEGDMPYGDIPWADYKDKIKTLVVEEGVTSIEERAFEDCTALSSVTLPQTLSSIQYEAFSNCTSLKSIDLPTGITCGGAAFSGSGLESITIPEGVTGIYSYTFEGCTALKSVDLPDTVTYIGESAFWGCTALERVDLPDTVTQIRRNAFRDCTALKSIHLPDAVTEIGVMAFKGCTALESIDLPENVTSLYGVFEESGLKSIVIPKSVTTLAYAFENCPNLTTVTIQDGYNASTTSAFSGCTSLTTVTLPDSMTTIGERAFYGCTALEHIDLPAALTSIGRYAFQNSGLKSIFIPKSVTTLKDAFAFAYNLTTVTIEDGCTSSLEYAFGSCTNLTAVTLSDSMTAIGACAFYGSGLASIAIPESVTVIDKYAFGNCMALRTVDMGSRVAEIRDQAFTGCESLTKIIFQGDCPAIEEDAFTGVTADAYYDGAWNEEDLRDYGGQLTWRPMGELLTFVRIDQEYLALEVGETVTLTAAVDPGAKAVTFHWSADPSGVVSIIPATGEIKAEKQGTCTVTVTAFAEGGGTYSASCRVDVTENVAEELLINGVHLGASSLTTELFKTDYAEFDVILGLSNNLSSFSMAAGDPAGPVDNGVAIDSAEFADAATAAVFDLVVKDDRTLQVVPKASAIDNPKTVAGKYTSKVTVRVGGQAFTTGTALSLTVKKTLPKLKAETVTFNTFYHDGWSKMIHFSGGEVTEVRRNTAMDTAKTTAVPEGMSLGNGMLKLLDWSPAKSAKVYVTATAEGWAKGVDVVVPVQVVCSGPKLKLSATTVTFAEEYSENNKGVKLQLLSGDKNVSLSDLNIGSIMWPDGFKISGLDSDGCFTITPTRKVTPGKITLYVYFSDAHFSVALNLNVKTKAASLTLKSTTVTLSSDHPDVSYIPITVTPADYDIADGFEYELTDSQGNPVDGSEMGYTILSTSDNEWFLRVENAGNTTKPNSTYKLRLGVPDGGKMSVLTIKTLPKGKEVSVSVKTSGAIDPTDKTSGVTVKCTFKNLNCFAAVLNEYKITAYKAGETDGEDVTDQFKLEDVQGDYASSYEQRFVCPKDYDAIDPSLTYKMKLGFYLQDGTYLPYETVLPIKRTSVKLKLSKTSLTLNKKVQDMAVLDLTCLTKSYDLQDVVLPDEYTGENAPLNIRFANGKLTVAVNDNTQYGATYKIPIRATENDPAVTLTVKIPAENKSTVTASLKAKGAIDAVRDGTYITVTPSYKNYMGLSDISQKLTIESWNGKKGENYQPVADGLFNVQSAENGTFTIAKAPGKTLDSTLKYRAMLTFEGGASAYVNLSVKSGTGKFTVSGTPVLYKLDRFSSGTFTVTTTDTTLNEIDRLEFKTPAHGEMFVLEQIGANEYRISFRDSKVPTGKIPTSIPVYVLCSGSDKPVATVNIKLLVR